MDGERDQLRQGRIKFKSGPLTGREFGVPAGGTTLGRAAECDIVLEDAAVSSRHGRLLFRDDALWIVDDGSTNGIMVNGRETRAAELRESDRVELGESCFSVLSSGAPAVAERALEGAPTAQAEAARPATLWRSRRWRRAVAAAVLLLAAGFLAKTTGCLRQPGMVLPATLKATARGFRRDGVKLTLRETAGVDRVAEPVTSGVPLPEGAVRAADGVSLLDAAGQPIPCQVIPQALWRDGSLKWALLDFQADLPADSTATYTLVRRKASALPTHPVSAMVSGAAITADNGVLRLEIHRDKPGLIHRLTVGGEERVAPAAPVDVVLVDAGGVRYRASAPSEALVETAGAMRSVILVRGAFEATDGRRIFGGKVGYALRITLYAGRSDIQLDFTLRNDGWYGYRNEGRQHPRQWLSIRSLRLDLPLGVNGPEAPRIDLAGRVFPVSDTNEVALTQWYKYPLKDEQMFMDINYTNLAHEVAAHMSGKKRGYYYVWTENGVMSGQEGTVDGRVALTLADGWTAALEARRIKENFPAGFSAARVTSAGAARLSFVMLPEGGCWPRTDQAFYAATYQFEGGRHKTATLLLKLGADAARSTTAALREPLFARAPGAWYRGTGAVLPLPDAGPVLEPATASELAEAVQRYDRLQIAKVRAEASDPVGISPPFSRDRWGRISIPDLWERCPETFAGWMNFGDLVWSFGYCSLFYDWPLAITSQYLRLDDPMMLTVGREMTRHRYDIDQYHVEKTQFYLGGFQRDERGQHGHLARQEAIRGRNVSWESNARPSHTWNRGLLLHWALTGDPRALAAAQANGRAFHRYFYEQHGLGKKEQLPYGEFRTPVWAMDNWLALYEYTGERHYLAWAGEIFDKTLLAMERANGRRGHILKDGRQGAQFVVVIGVNPENSK